MRVRDFQVERLKGGGGRVGADDGEEVSGVVRQPLLDDRLKPCHAASDN